MANIDDSRISMASEDSFVQEERLVLEALGEPVPVKSQDLWYPDGTVVLKAGDTHFCVYSGILAQHSLVFKDMFSLAQPTAHETFEGRPVVPMFEDSENVLYFLRSLHDHGYFETEIMARFSRLVQIFPMTSKYQAKYFRQLILNHILQDHYPSTLARYHALQRQINGKMYPSRHIQVANIAHSAEASILLPAALYHCCRTWDEDALIQGVSERGHKLNNEATLIVLRARTKLSRVTRTRIHAFAYYPTEDDIKPCLNPIGCRLAVSKVAKKWDQKERLFALDEFPLAKLANKICPPCMLRWRASVEKAQQDVWNELPSFFGLPGWAELTAGSQFDFNDGFQMQR